LRCVMRREAKQSERGFPAQGSISMPARAFHCSGSPLGVPRR
jgi:hypothetical protein